MIQQRKAIKSYNDMIQAYDNSCMKITSRYTHEMNILTNESIQTLCSLFQSYLMHKKVTIEACQKTQMQSTQQSSNKKQSNNGAKIYEEDYFYCPASVKKFKVHDVKQNQPLILSKKLGKLTLGQDEINLDQDETSEKKNGFQEDFKNKNIAEIIEASKKKTKQNIQKKQNQKIDIQSEESEYMMTDYSSNQSSNEGSYSPFYAEQTENKPLFGGLFSKTQSSQSNNSNSSNLLNFNFSSKQLLKSPKKQSKNKRLYVGNKKIPKWAEDLSAIQNKCMMQEKTGQSVFGRCVVQNLDTNVIFQGKKEGINRTSSAKWNSQPFLT